MNIKTLALIGTLVLAACSASKQPGVTSTPLPSSGTGGGSAVSPAPGSGAAQLIPWQLYSIDPSGPRATVAFRQCVDTKVTSVRTGNAITITVVDTGPASCTIGVTQFHRTVPLPGWRPCTLTKLIDGATGLPAPITHPHTCRSPSTPVR